MADRHSIRPHTTSGPVSARRELRMEDSRRDGADGHARTLEEIGQSFTLTRERIRQLEGDALRTLRSPAYRRELRVLLDG